MKKFFNLVFLDRRDISDTWWRRLIRVFVYFSTTLCIVVLLFSMSFKRYSDPNIYTFCPQPRGTLTWQQINKVRQAAGVPPLDCNTNTPVPSIDDVTYSMMLFKNFIIYVIFPSLLWFIFFYHVIYRVVLHIIYGGKKQKNN